VTAGVNEFKEGVTACLYKLETFHKLFLLIKCYVVVLRGRSAAKCMNSIVDFCRFLGQRNDNNETTLRMELIDETFENRV